MKHEAILRKALSGAVRALERIDAGGTMQSAEKTALDAAQKALEQTVEPETLTNRLRKMRLPAWSFRYSQKKGHEGDIVKTVYSAAGAPVCRVTPCRAEKDTERRVLMLAAAPEMLAALVDACGYMRSAGSCPFPACETCRIGLIIGQFKTKI
jgi:hypothetical protein